MGKSRQKVRKPRGRVKGIPVPSSAKFAEANRTRAWKHGLRAQVVTPGEVRRKRLEEIHPQGSEVVEAYHRALEDGDIEAVNPLAVVALSETEILRRQAFDEIQRDGLTIREAMVNSDGREIGSRLKAHPQLENIHRFNEELGFTAQDQLLSKKSRGEGARDDAIAKILERDSVLRRSDKTRMQPALPPARQLPS